ncbi:MAG: hypothetical protein JST04_12120 [Bdellovibrionales bacterium]|nr:hypothetical protein [Bdellovibrionales bacterium]
MTAATDRDDGDVLAGKLPAITAAFWVMKISATTLGETGGDWLSMTMNLGYLASTLVFFGIFVVALGTQLAVKRHHPFLYWTVIVATSTAGTTMSDYMDRTLELGYAKGAAILVTILIALLVAWKANVGNVDVSNVRSRKAEIFYWITILFSNTLGTALGDFLADDSGLGFFGSWCLITGILGVVLALAFTTKISRVLLFWIAFILTRPFGATFGDLLTKAHENGGLEFGRGASSLILLAVLLGAIAVSYRNAGNGTGPEPA